MKIASILWRLSLAVLLCGLTWSIVQIVPDVKQTLATIRQETVAVRMVVSALEGRLTNTVDNTAASAVSEVGKMRRTLDTRVQDMHSTVSGTVSALVNRTDTALSEVHEAVTSTTALLNNTSVLVKNTDHSITLITPQLLGAVAAGKVALGETAQAARRVDDALPQFLLKWEEIGGNIERATDEYAETGVATRKAMNNLYEATKPLPKWLRYPLSITGALAPTVSGAVSAAAAAGAFQ